MNEIKISEKKELGFKARTILNPDGSISVNAEDTAVDTDGRRKRRENCISAGRH